MDIYHTARNICSNSAFRFGIIGGIGGLLSDLDHFLTFGYPEKWGSRPFHPLLFGVACIVGIYCIARLGRLCGGVVLKRK